MSLVLAMLLDAALGEPRWLWDRAPHPAVLMGRVIGWGDRAFNSGGGRRPKGALFVLALCVGMVALGCFLGALGPLAEIIVTAVLLAQRSLVEHVRAVAEGLRMSLGEGRRSVAMIVGRDTAAMDESQVARAAIESAAENFSDGVLAPAFWFALAGLPGILLYKAVNTADSMIGHRTERHEEFGWAAARLDDVLNLVPARLSAVLFAGLTGGIARFGEIAREARRHRSPNAGWPEAAMARALDVALAGPRRYGGVLADEPYVNADGRREIGAAEVDGAVRLLWIGWAGAVALALLLNILS